MVLAGFGHEVQRVRDVGLQRTADPELLRQLVGLGARALLSLDLHRQPEVWSELLPELAEGRGRLIRLKLGGAEVPTIPVLTRYWSKGYERMEALLNDDEYVLIQVGREVTSSRPIRGGVRGYTRREVAHMVQQTFQIAPDGSLRVGGSPRLRPPRS